MATSRRLMVLLDGHSLAYRAFYALPDTLRTQSGELTNAVYGFTSMLIKLLVDQQPDVVAVAFDKGRDAQRTAAFADYKAQRAAPPDEFRPQIGMIKQVLEVLTVPTVEVEGVEADDVLATLATRAVADGFDVAIVTGDRDAMQIASDRITVLYTLRGISEMAEMGPQAVKERFGVPPEQYVDLAALRGDSSDNLPGVPGVGDKTAAKLIGQFGGVDGIYEHLDQVAGNKVPAMLAEHEEQVRLNMQLMRLRTNVDVDVELTTFDRAAIDMTGVRTLFGTLEFRALYDRFASEIIGSTQVPTDASPRRQPHRLEPGELAAWLDGAASPVAVVAAVTGRPPHVGVTAVGFASSDAPPVGIDLGALTAGDREALRVFLADPDRAKATHDAKLFDHAAHAEDWTVTGVQIDTELAAYLVNPQQRSFDLDRLALDHLQRTLEPDEQAAGDGQMALGVDDGSWQQVALRADATHELGAQLAASLDERGQSELLATIELPLAPVLARMERAGVAIDLEVLSSLRSRLAVRVDELEAEVQAHAGHPFKLGSGPQLQQVLFEELSLPKTRKIKTGYSTDAQALSGLRGHHAIVDALLEWRELTKLLSTYVDALPPLVDAVSGRIHTTLSQTVATTGRLSSSNPNLQNIPVRRREGREIRRAFVAGEGFDRLLVADYSQIELRILAHLSGDEGLLDAFAAGEDVHATTAAKVFDRPLDAVDSALRDRAKAVNYGLAYGLTSYGLGQQLGISPGEAQEIVDAYFARFPKVRSFLEQAVKDATRDGYTTTIFGRRRYLPDLRAEDRNRRQMAERMALNAPIQGTAADIIKLAMIRLDAALREEHLASQLLLQVHDEVILEVPDHELEQVESLVIETLSQVADLHVPLEVDTATGATWFDAQKH